MKRIFLSSPHMGDYEQSYIKEAFETNWIAPLGPNVDAFEQELAEYAGIKGALALNSGTAAIHLALKLLDVSTGDRVFCSSLTFVASANPILYQGAEPVFIDSEPETWNMSPLALERALVDADQQGKLPKAVVVVNLYGQSADMDPIVKLCNSYGIPIIEDAAESLGATYKNRYSGTLGRFGVFSFNGNKIITTSGGGMLVSNDLEALEKARFWAAQSRDFAKHYEHKEVGFNYRLSNVLAAIGRGQLKVLDQRVETRRNVYAKYYDAFSKTSGIQFMPEASFGRATRWLTALTIDTQAADVSPAQIMDALAKEMIESRPVWKPLHMQPLFKNAPYYSHDETRSISDELFKKGICLPSGSNLSSDDIERIISIIHHCLERGIRDSLLSMAE